MPKAYASFLVFLCMGFGIHYLWSDTKPKAKPARPSSVAEETGKNFQIEDFQHLPGKKILVRKSARKLELWKGGQMLREFPIALGFSPQSHKHREGDGKTPEGLYRVCVKNGNSRYHRSLGVSYPNALDGRRAFEEGRIGSRTLDAIIRKDEAGECPPWKTVLGGEIFIHGGGIRFDWTLGCVALENADVEALFSEVGMGDVVYIIP